jgi:hypothetical protein
MVLSYRYGNIYREVIKNEIEWCSAMENYESNPVVKHFVDMGSDQVDKSKIFMKCPIEIGQLGALNVTPVAKMPIDRIFPSGLYRDHWQFKKNGKVYFYIKYYFESKSEIKSSFG